MTNRLTEIGALQRRIQTDAAARIAQLDAIKQRAEQEAAALAELEIARTEREAREQAQREAQAELAAIFQAARGDWATLAADCGRYVAQVDAAHAVLTAAPSTQNGLVARLQALAAGLGQAVAPTARLLGRDTVVDALADFVQQSGISLETSLGHQQGMAFGLRPANAVKIAWDTAAQQVKR